MAPTLSIAHLRGAEFSARIFSTNFQRGFQRRFQRARLLYSTQIDGVALCVTILQSNMKFPRSKGIARPSRTHNRLIPVPGLTGNFCQNGYLINAQHWCPLPVPITSSILKWISHQFWGRGTAAWEVNKMGNPSNGPAVVKWLNIFVPPLKDCNSLA